MQISRFLTWTYYAAFLVLGMVTALLGPAKDTVTQRLGLALEHGGQLLAAQFLGAMAGVLASGRLADHGDMRLVMSGGGVLLIVGFTLFGSADSFALALAAAAVAGMGIGAWSGGGNIVFSRLGAARRGIALNVLNMMWGLGSILGPQLVGLALARGDLALAYTVAASLAALLAVAFLPTALRLPAPPVHSDSMPRGLAACLPFALLFFAYVGTETGFGGWISTQLTLRTQAPPALAMLGTSLFWAGLTAGRLGASVLLHRCSEQSLLLAATLTISLGAVFLLMFPQPPALALAWCFLVGIGCAPVFPTTIALLVKTMPHVGGKALAALQALGAFGAVLVPPLQGYAGAGKDGGLEVTVALGLLMAIIVFTVGHRLGGVGARNR